MQAKGSLHLNPLCNHQLGLNKLLSTFRVHEVHFLPVHQYMRSTSELSQKHEDFSALTPKERAVGWKMH